jgi:hypothetical protein
MSAGDVYAWGRNTLLVNVVVVRGNSCLTNGRKPNFVAFCRNRMNMP